MLGVQHDVSLKDFNTFGIDVKAKYFFQAKSNRYVEMASILAENENVDLLFLGEGSNVLLTEDFEGVVCKMETKKITLIKENPFNVWLRVDAGVSWDSFVRYCIDSKYYGLETLIKIPGTVGAAPIQNIGAYGHEVAEFIEQVKIYHIDNREFPILSNKQCKFSYRNSIFKNNLKNKAVVLFVVFKLSTSFDREKKYYGDIENVLKARKIRYPDARDIAGIVEEIRENKLPDYKKLPNAGSFFKNPLVTLSQLEKLQEQHGDIPFFKTPSWKYVKISAAWLIENSGWKGHKEGRAGVSAKHALILVNHGKAKGKEILSLAEKIKASVLEKYDIALEYEVNII